MASQRQPSCRRYCSSTQAANRAWASQLGCGSTSELVQSTLGSVVSRKADFTNKRRGEEGAWKRIEALKRDLARDIEVDALYFPVNLTQLSEFDPFAIPDGEETFQKVSHIPTDSVIRNDHYAALASAVELILDADQSDERRRPAMGWPVGPDGRIVAELGEAFVRSVAIARAASPVVERD